MCGMIYYINLPAITFAAMQYQKVILFTKETSMREILIARLAVEGYDGFEEMDDALHAYIPTNDFELETLQLLAAEYQFPYTVEAIGEQNWNAEWEKNFQPVLVDDFCTVRADFHQLDVATTYEIIITPKMSFGTGHHATTRMMVANMRYIDFARKSVLDFGTGTGILAILAEKMGATDIAAIDNDEWAYENTKENIGRNACRHIIASHGSLEQLPPRHYDVVLANINRHILLNYMQDMYMLTNSGGKVLISGLLTEDEPVIRLSAEQAGYKYVKTDSYNNWICIEYEK